MYGAQSVQYVTYSETKKLTHIFQHLISFLYICIEIGLNVEKCELILLFRYMLHTEQSAPPQN